MNEQMPEAVRKGAEEAEESRDSAVPEEKPDDIAERPGSTNIPAQHADELADEWGKESFPGSDPPAHY